MINEDIITSLKNAVERGETLESAISTAIGSGYNPIEVQEAAKYIGSGVINIEKISNDQILTMPNKKGFFSRRPQEIKPQIQQIKPPVQQIQRPVQIIAPAPQPQPQQLPTQQTAQQIKQSIQMQSISPPPIIGKKQSYLKEIILMILLLVLVGILIITVRYRDIIIKFFSG